MEVPMESMRKFKKIIAERLPHYSLDNLHETQQGGNCKYLPVDDIDEELKGYLIE